MTTIETGRCSCSSLSPFHWQRQPSIFALDRAFAGKAIPAPTDAQRKFVITPTVLRDVIPQAQRGRKA